VGYSPESNDVSTEAEESPLLRGVTKQRPVKTLQAGEDLACSDLYRVKISDSVVGVPSGVYESSINPFTNPYPVYSHTKIMTVLTQKSSLRGQSHIRSAFGYWQRVGVKIQEGRAICHSVFGKVYQIVLTTTPLAKSLSDELRKFIICYFILMTLSVTRAKWRRMSGSQWIMYYEGCGRKRLRPDLNYPSICQEENNKNISVGGRRPGRNQNWALTKYKS
jgi:hypothetical protein